MHMLRWCWRHDIVNELIGTTADVDRLTWFTVKYAKPSKISNIPKAVPAARAGTARATQAKLTNGIIDWPRDTSSTHNIGLIIWDNSAPNPSDITAYIRFICMYAITMSTSFGGDTERVTDRHYGPSFRSCPKAMYSTLGNKVGLWRV